MENDTTLTGKVVALSFFTLLSSKDVSLFECLRFIQVGPAAAATAVTGTGVLPLFCSMLIYTRRQSYVNKFVRPGQVPNEQRKFIYDHRKARCARK